MFIDAHIFWIYSRLFDDVGSVQGDVLIDYDGSMETIKM